MSNSVITAMAMNDNQVAEELVTLAYENGVNVFDTAEVYAGGKYEHVVILISPLAHKKLR